MIGRRQILTLAAGAALTWPPTGRTQQPALPVIGALNGQSPELVAPLMAAFHEGLNEAGYAEGRNVAIEYRWAEGQYARLPALAAELVQRNVTVIFAAGATPAPLAAQAATTTIPIVFVAGLDPVATGLVASLGRPGGNLTGATIGESELVPKRLELLHELVPAATTIAVLLNPANDTTPRQTRDIAEAARVLGLQLRLFMASTEREIDAAFASMAQEGARALLVSSDAIFAQRLQGQIVALAARHGIAAAGSSTYAAAGALIGYGSTPVPAYRQAGHYVGRVLDGERPADLPVVQTTGFDLAVNLRTAAALGLTVPPAILLRATELIE